VDLRHVYMMPQRVGKIHGELKGRHDLAAECPRGCLFVNFVLWRAGRSYRVTRLAVWSPSFALHSQSGCTIEMWHQKLSSGATGGGATRGLAGIGSGVFRLAFMTGGFFRDGPVERTPLQGLGGRMMAGDTAISGWRTTAGVTADRWDGLRRSRTGLHRT
jgi:hypothetical protein